MALGVTPSRIGAEEICFKGGNEQGLDLGVNHGEGEFSHQR